MKSLVITAVKLRYRECGYFDHRALFFVLYFFCVSYGFGFFYHGVTERTKEHGEILCVTLCSLYLSGKKTNIQVYKACTETW